MPRDMAWAKSVLAESRTISEALIRCRLKALTTWCREEYGGNPADPIEFEECLLRTAACFLLLLLIFLLRIFLLWIG